MATSPTGAPIDADPIDWQAFIDHREMVAADQTLEAVHQRFQHIEADFMAVLDGEQLIGLCSRQLVGMQLGSKYGYSLFAKHPIREFMETDPLRVTIQQACPDLLAQVFARPPDSFHDDVPLVDERGVFLGLISIHTLIRLQNRLFIAHIGLLEQKRAEIARRNQQMTEELLMAREMQLAMLPEKLPLPKSGESPVLSGSVRLLRHYAPLGLVSGDFYEVLTLSETRIALFIADVMGHGVQAALVTAMVRALIQDHSELAADPGQFLTALNRNLCDIFASCQMSLFMSGVAVVADLARGTLCYANAGHPCPILLRRAEGTMSMLDCLHTANGGLLGVSREAWFQSASQPLWAGDVLLMFTDGLFEVQDCAGELLGLEGLLALAAAHARKPGEILVRDLVAAVGQIACRGEFEDDVCLLGLEVLDIQKAVE